MSKTRILHIGDLHFISELQGDVLFERLKDDVIPLLDKDQSKYDNYDLVVMSGDVAGGSPKANEDLRGGFEFLGKFREEIGSPPLLICVGNHDATRPDIDENFLHNGPVNVFNSFIAEYNAVRKGSESDFARPLCPNEKPSKQDVELALKELVAANFDRSKLDNEKKDILPFFWLKEKGVFCYLLSTVDFSAVRFTKRGIEPKEILKAINDGIENEKISEYLKGRAFMRDIPFVRMTQLSVLEWIVDYLGENPTTKVHFKSSIKIAVFHHPLILLPEEAKIQEFDGVSNGQSVAVKLTKCGFFIFLYGHKHWPRISVNFGHWTRDSEKSSVGFIGLCGDQFIGQAGQVAPTFIVLEVEDISNTGFLGKAVSLKKVSIAKEISDPQRIISFDYNGSPKWIHCDNKCLIFRHQPINEKFWNLVKKIENCFLSTTESAWTTDYKDAEAFLFEFMDFLDGYCRGRYGLDKEFFSQLEKDLEVADALYFIDKLESPAWAHPNFMHHLALQIKAYSTQNHTQLKSGSWLHSDAVAKALQKPELQPVQKGKIKLPKPEKLSIDICRILIWDKMKLNTIFGKTLIMLHDIFNIPLFFLDKQYYGEKFLGFLPDDVDFHLVIEGKSVKGFAYDEAKRSRQPIENAEEYLISYQRLLADPNLKYAKQVARLLKEEWK